ncbi:MAG: hypothetical protein U0237_02220 [Thermoleophilia bacterium]
MKRPQTPPPHGLLFTNEVLWSTQDVLDDQEPRLAQLARRSGNR